PNGEVIIFAAVGGPNGGIWRSLDTGKHWQLMRAGQATDVVLSPNSGTAGSNNLQVVYGAFLGEGVFLSPNQGQTWNLMTGLVGNPLFRDNDVALEPAIPVTAPASTPNGAQGRILLATPALTGDRVQDLLYQGWLYAAVSKADGHLDGLYVTKDFGDNWTKVRIPLYPLGNKVNSPPIEGYPTNDVTKT